jgi:uncharacterized protein YjbI with pentapeptide repeats
MADQAHVDHLGTGREAWNQWRAMNPKIIPDLRKATLRGADLSGFNFFKTNLSGAHLSNANLESAVLAKAHLWGSHLRKTNLKDSDLRSADARGADFTQSCLHGAVAHWAVFSQAQFVKSDLRLADLSGADLELAVFMGTDLRRANLSSCRVFGVSAWDLNLDQAVQSNLVITKRSASQVQVDNLEVAQFIYLLLNNKKNPTRHRHDHIQSGPHPWPVHTRAEDDTGCHSR